MLNNQVARTAAAEGQKKTAGESGGHRAPSHAAKPAQADHPRAAPKAPTHTAAPSAANSSTQATATAAAAPGSSTPPAAVASDPSTLAGAANVSAGAAKDARSAAKDAESAAKDAQSSLKDAQATTDKGKTDPTTTDKLTTDKATTDKATTDKATTDKATTDKATADAATSDKATTGKATTDTVTTDKATADASASGGTSKTPAGTAATAQAAGLAKEPATTPAGTTSAAHTDQTAAGTAAADGAGAGGGSHSGSAATDGGARGSGGHARPDDASSLAQVHGHAHAHAGGAGAADVLQSRTASEPGVASQAMSDLDGAQTLQSTLGPAGARPAPGPAGYGAGLSRAIENVRATIELGARQGFSLALIKLAPVALGEIRIHLQRTDAGLVARVVTEHAAAAQTLQQGSGELRRSLQAAGVNVLRLDIETRQDSGAASPNPGGQASPTGRVGRASDDEATDDVPAPVHTTIVLPSGALVNVLA